LTLLTILTTGLTLIVSFPAVPVTNRLPVVDSQAPGTSPGKTGSWTLRAAAEMAVEPLLVAVSTVTRVPPLVNVPANVESRARTDSGAGSPVNHGAGRNRSRVDPDRARAVGPSPTAPTPNHVAPSSVEYCQVPWSA